jgi:BMFP domain-containing protein YqiC
MGEVNDDKVVVAAAEAALRALESLVEAMRVRNAALRARVEQLEANARDAKGG